MDVSNTQVACPMTVNGEALFALIVHHISLVTKLCNNLTV